MPSMLLQSRISQFEALSPGGSSSSRTASTSLLDEAPHSAEVRQLVSPITPRQSSTSPSPPSMAKKPSLADLHDWVVDDGPRANGVGAGRSGPQHPLPPPRRTPSGSSRASAPYKTASPPPLIMLQSPPRMRVVPPQLPPRKPSYSSLKSVSSDSSTSTRPPPRTLDSLAVPSPVSPSPSGTAFPPLSSPGRGFGHAQASSISSFHSVSLSSDGDASPNLITDFPLPADRDEDRDSISNESYDHLSATSTGGGVSPLGPKPMDWQLRGPPPKLPQRRNTPASTPASSIKSPPGSHPTSPTLTPLPYAPRERRAPPPPPIRSPRPPSSRTSVTSTSDRSSIMSNLTSSTSRTSISGGHGNLTPNASIKQALSRPTPVPPAARRRYETVFVANVLHRRRTGSKSKSKGWRGLSVDLITSEDGHEGLQDEEMWLDERLDGSTVAAIWSKSRLDRAKLRQIWAECDSTSQGSLDREGFVRGMWRIDEELLRAQIVRNAQNPPSSFRARQPKRVTSRSSLRR